MLRIFGYGPVKITPLFLRSDTALDLDRVRSAVSEFPYEPQGTQAGWGEIYLDEIAPSPPSEQVEEFSSKYEMDGASGASGEEDPAIAELLRQGPGSPKIVGQGENYQALLLRRLEDRPKNVLARIPAEERPDGVTLEDIFDLVSLDTIVVSSGSGQLVCLVNSQNEIDIESLFVHPFASAMAQHGLEVRKEGGSLLEVADPNDFFLWLLRHSGDQIPGTDVTLRQVRSIEARNAQDERIRFLDWMRSKSSELSAAVRPHNRFGPAKLILLRGKTDKIDMFLKMDGSFDLHVGQTLLDGDPIITPGQRVQAVRAVAFQVLPRIVGSYVNDEDWHDQGRERFYAEAIERVRKSLPLT